MQGVNLRDAALLSLERNSGEPSEPFGYVDSPIGSFQSFIVAFLIRKNRGRQGEKDRTGPQPALRPSPRWHGRCVRCHPRTGELDSK
jgi:hypothetical protein